jgi:hypothetical protein
MFFQQIQLKKSFFILIGFFLLPPGVIAQAELEYADRIYSENIRTVQLYPEGDPMGYPIIRLNTDETLVLEFDDLSSGSNDYYYSFIHCTPDWEPSDLMETEYIDGFSEDEILDYEYSFNTLKDYIHYRAEFPTDFYMPRLSGNYLLLVFKDYDRSQLVLSRRFRILDEKAHISAELKRSELVSKADCCTQFRVRVQDVSAGATADVRSTALYIHRNNSERFALRNLEPDFIQGNVLVYNNPRKLFLPGANEFRYTNLKNRQRQTDRVADVGFIDPYYIFTLYPDIHKPHIYLNNEDINGKYLITSDHTDYPMTEAEYVLADFHFRTKEAFSRDVYLHGELTNHKIAPENKMEYDAEKGMYHLRKMLKQGFYNYHYVLHDPETGEISLSETEGNFYQTENDFNLYFYYKAPGDIYHQLIAYLLVNSQRKM